MSDPAPSWEHLESEHLEVLRRRYQEARKAGLSMVEARLWSESDAATYELRRLVANGCPPSLIVQIVL